MAKLPPVHVDEMPSASAKPPVKKPRAEAKGAVKSPVKKPAKPLPKARVTVARGTARGGQRPVLFTPASIAEAGRLYGLGMTQGQVAAALGISERTLQEHMQHNAELRASMDAGKARAVGAVLAVLYDVAIVPDPRHAADRKLWLHNVAGWSDKGSSELSGPGGRPLQFEQTADLSKLTAAELESLLALVEKAAPPDA